MSVTRETRDICCDEGRYWGCDNQKKYDQCCEDCPLMVKQTEIAGEMCAKTEIINELIGIVDYLASIVERLAKQLPDDRDVPIAREVAVRAGRLRQEAGV